ncbi:hypothetical protein [Kineococcus gypseus]|uniref:hypothetical protein n=1 Tax=Kineococcus gypseus TaxID=1637102 RepID=UPI003D7D8334
MRSETSGAGRRVVLRGVSVTQVTAGAVTVAALEQPVCPPGLYCGAGLLVAELTVAWSGAGRPAAGGVVDLFGTTVPGSLAPVGHRPSDECHVDTGWC